MTFAIQLHNQFPELQLKLERLALQAGFSIGEFKYKPSSRTYLGGTVTLHNIRLTESKHYCGNHPAECEVNSGPSRKAKYLEGADWARFNDLINDLLDDHEISANVGTSQCVIRKGRKRRIRYAVGGRHSNGQAFWDKEGLPSHYEQFEPGQHPVSAIPYGTPGATSSQLAVAI